MPEDVVTVAPVQRPQINGGLFNGQRPSIFSINRPLPRIRPPVPITSDAKAVTVNDVPEEEQDQVKYHSKILHLHLAWNFWTSYFLNSYWKYSRMRWTCQPNDRNRNVERSQRPRRPPPWMKKIMKITKMKSLQLLQLRRQPQPQPPQENHCLVHVGDRVAGWTRGTHEEEPLLLPPNLPPKRILNTMTTKNLLKMKKYHTLSQNFTQSHHHQLIIIR